MNRCSFCEWIPILPWPIWPLAGQLLLGQNVVVGSMTLLLAVRGKHCHEKYVGTPVFFTTALHHGLVWSYRRFCARVFPRVTNRERPEKFNDVPTRYKEMIGGNILSRRALVSLHHSQST